MSRTKSATYQGYVNITFPSTAEMETAQLLYCLGAVAPGQPVTNAYEFYEQQSSLRNWQLADVDAASSARADTAARFDSVTAVGLAIDPIVQSAYDSGGNSSGTLQRFNIPPTALVGQAMAFEPNNPVRVDVQAFVGTELPTLTVRLVDQANNAITDTMGEPFSAVVVLDYELE